MMPDTNDAIAQRRRLAQALMSQGTSTEPVGHWTQAAARIAQALSGSANMGYADSASKQREAFDVAEAQKQQASNRAYSEGAMQREIAQKTQIAQQAGLQPGSPEFKQYVYGIKPPDQNADLERRFKEAQIAKLQAEASGTGNLSAADYTKGAPSGVMWNDPKDPSKGTRPVPGYEQPIPGDVAGKFAQMADAKTRIANTRSAFERDWGAGDVAKFGAANVPLIGDIAALSGDIGIAQRDVRVGIEAALRTMTGAAAPEQEVQRYLQMYMPTPLDTPESAKQKLDGLVSFMDRAEKIVMQGRGGVPSASLDGSVLQGRGNQPLVQPQADDVLQQAREAIARGADRNAVIQRLQQSGINPAGL